MYQTQFDKFIKLMDEAFKNMLADVRVFETNGYVVLHDQIGYKDNDRINTYAVKRYETFFPFFQKIVKIILVLI